MMEKYFELPEFRTNIASAFRFPLRLIPDDILQDQKAIFFYYKIIKRF